MNRNEHAGTNPAIDHAFRESMCEELRARHDAVLT
jgi:hypothetical protein